MSEIPKSTDSTEEKFFKFQYREIRDLSRHFLTVITAVLVFSVTFSEKILNFQNMQEMQRWLLVSSWLTFFIAIILSGGTIFLNYIAATDALANKQDKQDKKDKQDEQGRMKWKKKVCYWALNVSGVLFVLGLLMLGFVAMPWWNPK